MNGKSWKKVSDLMGKRSPIQCLHRWSKILKPGLIKGPWTVHEDLLLVQWIETKGPNQWTKCSNTIFGRSGKQCRERYLNILSPDIKKGCWSIAEDYIIFKSFRKYGSKWSQISTCLEGRSENSVKNRFYSTLRKHLNQLRHDQDTTNLPSHLTEKAINLLRGKTTKKCTADELLLVFPYVFEHFKQEYQNYVKNRKTTENNEINIICKIKQRLKKNAIKKPKQKLSKLILGSSSSTCPNQQNQINNLPSFTNLSTLTDLLCEDISLKDINLDKLDSQLEDLIDKVVLSLEDYEKIYNCLGCKENLRNTNNIGNNQANLLSHRNLLENNNYFNKESCFGVTSESDFLNKNNELLKILNELNNLESLFLSTKIELQNYDNLAPNNNNCKFNY